VLGYHDEIGTVTMILVRRPAAAWYRGCALAKV